jgi:DNA-binding NarL/FixJ family response regulator
VIRVLIVDDHALMRSGLTAMLDNAWGVMVVGVCSDGAEVAEMARLSRPDVVLMDFQMRRTGGPPATRDLLANGVAVRVLMMSASVSQRRVADAAAAGAVGYVAKGSLPDRMIDAIRTVAAGGTAWPDHLGLAESECRSTGRARRWRNDPG